MSIRCWLTSSNWLAISASWLRELDQGEHEPQIAGDRRLASGYRHQLGVDAMAGLPEPMTVLSDHVGLISARIAKRIGDAHQRPSRPLKLAVDPLLDPRQLPGESLPHQSVLAHDTLATAA